MALAAIVVGVGFLAAAMASITLPEATRRGLWLPLHLALAGGASSAIAGVMPFFVAAFAAAQPADVRLRVAGLVGVAGGALAVALGVIVAPGGPVAAAGGVAFLAGIASTALAVTAPLAGALGPSRGIVTQAYFLALGSVGVGALVGTLQVAGWDPVVETWARLRPVHGWLNLVGFASLVTATTLLHFFPTVVGSRIAPHPSARITVLGIGGGAILVAAGYWLGIDVAVQVGAAGAGLGALALATYAVRIWRARARWTTDLDWHRFAIGGLASAIAWFVIGMTTLVFRSIALGAAPSGWSIQRSVAPLIAGWLGLAIVASATHLLPAIGPGDQQAHARQRSMLGIGALPRLLALNAGVATLTLGPPLGIAGAEMVGLAFLGLGFLTTAFLLARAAWIGGRIRPGAAVRG